MSFRKAAGVAGAPFVLAAALVAASLLMTGRGRPLYESTVRLETAPILVLREFNGALVADTVRSTGAAGPLRLGDLPELSLARHDVQGSPLGRTAESLAVVVDPQMVSFSIVARARSAVASASIANTYAEALLTRRDERVRQRISDLSASLAMLRELAARDHRVQRRIAVETAYLERLNPLRQLSGGGVSIVRRADTPHEPVAPRITRNALAAALLGVLLGLTPTVAGTSWQRVGRRIYAAFRSLSRIGRGKMLRT